MRATVIDYKAGNLTSVVKALLHLGADVTVTENPADLSFAERIILPGVGHFQATTFLEQNGLKQAIADRIGARVPFLGICVGLQWLCHGSTEASGVPGLGAFDAVCDRFALGQKIPHVGWNALAIGENSRLLRGIPNGSFVYFTHSYRVPVMNATVAVTEYGVPFTAAAEHANVMGVQFHPEKSGRVGLQILRNFLELSFPEIPC